jgi:hypothetical protein
MARKKKEIESHIENNGDESMFSAGKINLEYVSKWLTQLGEYESKLAMCELKVLTLPKLFSRYKVSDEERLQDQMTIDLLREQFSIFNYYTSSLTKKQIAAIEGKIKKQKDVDSLQLKQGMRELATNLMTMSKYDEIKPTITTAGFLMIRWGKNKPPLDSISRKGPRKEVESDTTDFDPFAFWVDLMEVRRY